jgi:serine phosphatase RsbU (regulator of sigma subunit)
MASRVAQAFAWENRSIMAMLVRTRGTHQGKWIYPLEGRCRLGRSPECDICDLFQRTSAVSRVHAQIDKDGQRFTIEDQGSRNGTSVNGKRLVKKTALRNGDRITICDVELTFYESDPAEPAAEPSTHILTEREERPERPGAITSRPVAAPSPATNLSSPERLRALAQMLQRLGKSLDVEQTLRELLSGLFVIFPLAERGFVAFAVEGKDQLVAQATHCRHPEAATPLAMSRTLIKQVLTRREAVLWTDQEESSELSNAQSIQELNLVSVMCVPLLDGEGNPFGVVQIDSDQAGAMFSADDLEVMTGAVSQAAVAVRYARMSEQLLRRQTMERDLLLAQRVQLSLLPAECPHCPGYEFFAYYQTAYEVGGDYYDFVPLPNGRMAIVIADVAGKGVSAALLAAKLSGELKYYLSCETPRAAIARMNDSLCQSSAGRFVTLLVAVLEPDTRALTLINAGHPAPLRRRSSGAVEAIGEAGRGVALGILADQQYDEQHFEVEDGDLWFVVTDGFTEATDQRGQMYGGQRLREQLATSPGVVREAGDRIVGDVQQFLGNQPPSDDMCLVGWGRMGDDAGPVGGLLETKLRMSSQVTQRISQVS